MPTPADSTDMRSHDISAAATLRVHRRLVFLTTLALLATVIVNLAATGSASASAGYEEQHLVARVLDGDTVEVYGPGQTSGTKQTVRLIGVNTNETGTCHAETATDRLQNLVEGKWVTLKAEDENSRALDGRYLRFVERNGVDMSLLMIEESHGFHFRIPQETSRDEQYALASYWASVAGQRIWDTDFCGNGPRQNVPLRMIINWDADGVDGGPETLNGEWFRVFNDDSRKLNVGGWTIREAATRGRFELPAGTQIPAEGYLTVYVGSGTNSASKVYLGLDRALFNNEIGDAGFLVDPDGDIRVHFSYPCVAECSDELQGAMDISANADAEGIDNDNPNGEWINITNISDNSFNLYGYLLRSGAKQYTFPSNSTIHPGERLRLHIGSGSDTRLKKHWGRSGGILSNDGPESIAILTYNSIILSDFSWPCDPCGPVPDITIHDYKWDAGPGPDDPRDEWLEIKNEGSTAVDLRDWLVMDNANRYNFDSSHVLAAGAKIRIYVGSGSDSGNTLYWNQPQEILFSNDKIQVFSPHRDLVDCTAWGNRSCGTTTAPTSCNGLNATIVGSESNEVIHGTSGNDVIVGAGGNDTIYGNGGNDTICGNDGADTIHGGGGHDTLLGGGGDDTIAGNAGNDTLRGDGGEDRARFDTSDAGVTVDLVSGTATGQGSDVLTSIEHLVGSDYADVLRGDGNSNEIKAGAGADVIEGRGGKDTLEGQGGNDTIRGGSGADKIWGQSGDDTINGGGGADTIRGDGGLDTIEGGSGNDFLRGGPDDDVIRGKSGKDILHGQAGRDKLYGGSDPDTLEGGAGFDLCRSGTASSCES
ncbi:MAG: hypothetical protein GY720_05860 [bacterium]|nr:hypothetical protein [bacterium]